ncbi:aryl-alcohol dehydrogenase-like predicted oxidoreductase [Ectopseudomonas oleovorans]|uniref:Aryl-alcohol dehydrogenase-like predicted oxidoreductase n=1 Tax=Ectopseudomonas oleovorans TaxID=301 RepID=A0A397NPM8_ECTOL|nr:aldo/keto reductase [Pseudomonas oleovorans]RIA35604.1 aryl-alcohol dehydrogenase-like predicted oxidoreductase [Pseudomonas oleovorans]
MSHRSLGRSGLQVSPLTLGSMMFGGQTDAEVSRRIIDTAFDQGINFIDTADVYNAGRSEEIVGQAIAARRDDWVLASKVGMGQADGRANRNGLSRKHILRSIDASLRRLGTDYLDIYYLHREDQLTPLEESVSAIGDLLRQGKIRYWGVSNYRGWRIAEIANVAERLGVAKPIVSQPLYNLVNRQAEVEQITAAAFHGLGVVPYSPLARGVLSGKYQPGVTPDGDSRAGRNDKRILETEWRDESLQIAQQVKQYAEQRGVGVVESATLNHASLRWCLAGASWSKWSSSNTRGACAVGAGADAGRAHR